MTPTQCKSCGQYIFFLRTQSGKLMPVDAESVADIEYELPDMDEPEYAPLEGHVSHFSTCPNADKHRRRK